jgi:hypothetical protein
MSKITKTYQATITISYDSADEDINVDEISSNLEDWFGDAIAEDNLWSDGSFEVDLKSWKEVK